MHKILIVDDQKIERTGIKFLIHEYRLDLEVAEAENGNKALDYIRNHDLDILFTDIRMPFMDGLTLAEQTRIIKPDVKIVIFSAYGEFEYARKALELHVHHYVLKPVQDQEFLDAIRSVFELCAREKAEKERTLRLLDGYRNALKRDDTDRLLSIPSEILQVSKSPENGINKAVMSAVKFIHDNYMRPIGVEAVAAEVYLSADYLNSLFKEQTGYSLMKYITSCRLKKAEELLKGTNRKIADIGKCVGYQDTSYFCMIFKNCYGDSPAKYREKVE
ncbi:response regulator [Cohnella endophytica]|uniref:Response regulator n=1 Tax=Cohnella endophytica TaxID=2419778 RepID=A0A494XX49_9BACL|nr:response regulator [Cohnella endophytica]RKP55155.1 response regulator [Cohnella endophytica]